MSSPSATAPDRTDASEKKPGNKIVQCPHCSEPMKAKRLPHHISVRHKKE